MKEKIKIILRLSAKLFGNKKEKEKGKSISWIIQSNQN